MHRHHINNIAVSSQTPEHFRVRILDTNQTAESNINLIVTQDYLDDQDFALRSSIVSTYGACSCSKFCIAATPHSRKRSSIISAACTMENFSHYYNVSLWFFEFCYYATSFGNRSARFRDYNVGVSDLLRSLFLSLTIASPLSVFPIESVFSFLFRFRFPFFFCFIHSCSHFGLYTC